MAQPISIRLDEQHIEIVERFGRDTGITSFPEALRAMIFQFDKLRAAAAAEVEGTAAALLIGVSPPVPADGGSSEPSRKRAANGGRSPQAGSAT